MLNQYKLDKNNFLFKKNGKLYEAPFGHGDKAITINDRLPTARFEIYFTNSSTTDPMTGECLPENSQKRFFTDMPTDIEYITNAFTCDTPEELTKIYKTEEPLGMWYWIFDDGTLLLSGIFDAKNDEEFIRKFFFMD